jgi:hypothetical protein
MQCNYEWYLRKESFTKMNHKIKLKKAILKFQKGKKIPIKKICCQAQLGSICTTKNKNGYTKKIQRTGTAEHMNRNKKKGKEGGQSKRTKNRKKVNQRVTTIKNAQK